LVPDRKLASLARPTPGRGETLDWSERLILALLTLSPPCPDPPLVGLLPAGWYLAFGRVPQCRASSDSRPNWRTPRRWRSRTRRSVCLPSNLLVRSLRKAQKLASRLSGSCSRYTNYNQCANSLPSRQPTVLLSYPPRSLGALETGPRARVLNGFCAYRKVAVFTGHHFTAVRDISSVVKTY